MTRSIASNFANHNTTAPAVTSPQPVVTQTHGGGSSSQTLTINEIAAISQSAVNAVHQLREEWQSMQSQDSDYDEEEQQRSTSSGKRRITLKTNSVQNEKRPRMYYYSFNPKGEENWKKWFRVCKNCRKWGAHYAHYCKEAPHPKNTADSVNEVDPMPLSLYPGNMAEAIETAQAEKQRYGEKCVFNCPPEIAPSFNI